MLKLVRRTVVLGLLVFLVFGMYIASPISAAQGATGWVEITVFLKGENMSGRCQAAVTSLGGSYPYFLEPSGGLISADLRQGSYMITVVPMLDSGPDTAPSIIMVDVAAGSVTKRSVMLSTGQVPDLSGLSGMMSGEGWPGASDMTSQP